MASDSPVFISGVGSFSSDSTIPELISFTRSAFRPSDFDMVEKILVARESKLKEEYTLMYDSHGEEVLKRLVVEEKLTKNKKELESLRKDLSGKDEIIHRLNGESTELKSSKSRAESEIDESNKRFEKLNERVSRLEEETETLGKVFLSSKMKQTEEKETFGDEKPGRSTSSSPNRVQAEDQHSFDVASGNGCPIKKQPVSESGSFGGKKLGPQFDGDIIEIDDSDDDDENPKGDGTKSVSNSRTSVNKKRKRSSQIKFSSDDDDDDDVDVDGSPRLGKIRLKGELARDDELAVPTSSRQESVFIRRCEEKPEATRKLQVEVDDNENLSDSYIENLVAKIKRKKENSRAWALEVDMKRALESNDELCMNAVCALYRQRNSMNRINSFDAQRATALAERLIDGDPQRKLKKSSSEWMKTDPKSMDECRKLALLYSKQLFEIYKKHKDPFF